MRKGLPYTRAGQAVGLLGGSFDPAHQGHVHITLEALKRFGLDEVWWLVSPANPLKVKGPAPLSLRMSRARKIMSHPRVKVTDVETQLGTKYTWETLEKLKARYPGVQFVWLMGADNLSQLHKWHHWQRIANQVPLGVLARPGDRISACTGPAARILKGHRLAAQASHLLARSEPPVWCFVNVPMVSDSSSAIRSSGGW